MRLPKNISSEVNVHATVASSAINGPGNRLVVFFQGCEMNCPGCFNTDLHAFEEKNLLTPEDILKCRKKDCEGITVSGGEPFLQPLALLELTKAAKVLGLTTVVYTGYNYDEIKAENEPREILEYIDVLIDGVFMANSLEPTLLARGSTNQRFLFLTDRYSLKDFLMPGKVEITIDADGTVTKTGFSRMPSAEQSAV